MMMNTAVGSWVEMCPGSGRPGAPVPPSRPGQHCSRWRGWAPGFFSQRSLGGVLLLSALYDGSGSSGLWGGQLFSWCEVGLYSNLALLHWIKPISPPSFQRRLRLCSVGWLTSRHCRTHRLQLQVACRQSRQGPTTLAMSPKSLWSWWKRLRAPVPASDSEPASDWCGRHCSQRRPISTAGCVHGVAAVIADYPANAGGLSRHRGAVGVHTPDGSTISFRVADSAAIVGPSQGRRQIKKCGMDTHGERAEREPMLGSGGRAPSGVQGRAFG